MLLLFIDFTPLSAFEFEMDSFDVSIVSGGIKLCLLWILFPAFFMFCSRKDFGRVACLEFRLEEDLEDFPFTCFWVFAFGLLASVDASSKFDIVDIALAT